MNLHYILPINSKNSNHKNISLTGTGHCNCKPCENIQFEKDVQLYFFKNILENLSENQSAKLEFLTFNFIHGLLYLQTFSGRPSKALEEIHKPIFIFSSSRLRVMQKALQLPVFFFLLSFLPVILERLAQVLYLFLFYCCFRWV